LTTDAMNSHRAAPLNCAKVCFQTVLSSTVICNCIPKLSCTLHIGELLVAESLIVAVRRRASLQPCLQVCQARLADRLLRPAIGELV
jgi:hypothetical protein